uniref:Putative reverse transcriptase domain-containing protein n=1 Tax=Tanacetum cinerariifolium TaxID=118510 RepID=A0A699JD96_TANCI|nr:putative reverse transcriptase domain-containing protein [Tanacetum cinerariifolium]
MDAPTLLVSAENNPGDPIDIRVDIVHPTPADVFPAATVIRTLVQDGEAIRGIHGHLEGVPVSEEMNSLRFRMGMVEEENASLRGSIKTIEAIDTITRRQNNTIDDGSQNSGGGPRRPLQPTRVCSYTDFIKCQPLNFKGTKGVVGLSQWVEKMESVFHISGCAVENQVDKYISGLPDNIHENIMAARPKTLDDAIELANDLMDQKLCTYVEGQAENKRKLDNNHQAQQQRLKKQNVA